MDSRRLILMLIFSFSAVMLWDAWQRHNNPALYAQQNKAPVTANQSGAAVPSPSTNLQAATADGTASAVPTSKVETVTVTTDLYKAEVSTQGGDLVRLELLKHKNHDQKNNLVLFDSKFQYAAQSGLIGEGMPNHKSLFKVVSQERVLVDGAKELKLRLEAVADGAKVAKIITFSRSSYEINVGWEIENTGQKPLAPHAYYQLQRNGDAPEGEIAMVSTFTGPAVYTEAEKYQKIEFGDVAKEKAKFAKTADNGWVAMVQHYFVSAWAPKGNSQREFYMRKVNADGSIIAAGLILPVSQVTPGSKATLEVPLFAGPQEQSLLKNVAPGLDLVVDYGWLTMIAAPIFWALEWIYQKLVGNWGWAIVILTILIKAAFYPLSAASYRSMAKMRTVTPRLMQLKERFGDDKQRLNQEMMKLYQTEKINPLGGCLPILVQIPVFIALYWVLLGAVEMRGAPWMGWITDLSASDPYYVLPIIMMVTMLIQTKLNPTPPDPIQAKVMLAMPFIFGFMFFFFPAGLVLYWVVNNILSIAQQWQITRAIEGAKKA